MAKHPLAGSERAVVEGSKVVGCCDPAETIEVVVMLRRQDEQQFKQLMSKIESGDAGAARFHATNWRSGSAHLPRTSPC